MPVGICGDCGNPIPDSFHNYTVICDCLTKEQWIVHYKRNKWMLKIDGEGYDFTKRK